MSRLSNEHDALRVLFVVAGNPTSNLARIKRIQLFARGLSELGSRVSILYLDNEQRPDSRRNLHWHNDDNISSLIVRTRHSVSPALRKFLGNFIDGQTIAETYEKHKFRFRWNCVFIYGQSYSFQRNIVRQCSKDGVLCVTDLTEWFPSTIRSIASPNHWDQLIFRNWFLAKYSAVVCISTEWLAHAARKRVVPILIPAMSTLTDADSALPNKPRRLCENQFFTIGYVGVMSDRDLPWLMVDVIEACIELDLPVRFLVIGNVSRHIAGRKVQKYVNEHPNLGNYVVFTGWLERENMKEQMQNVDAFLLLRENNLYSRACFATRLPELLEAARTVITSDIGDIDRYLSNHSDAILIPPTNQKSTVVDAIKTLIDEPVLASRIGASGRITARTRFGYRQYAKQLHALLSGLLK